MIRLHAALVLALVGLSGPAQAQGLKNIELKDPAGDDKGPGTYTYPTKAEYKPGSFDLIGVSIADKGATLELKIRIKVKVEDPWDSKSWGGNGFSLQLVQVYIDNKKGGFLEALPGINVRFAKGEGWDKVIFVSPQPKAKVLSEVKTKKANMLKGLVVPTQTFARGQEIVAVVAKSDLGGAPTKDWGFQVVMQSNEGYPDQDSVLARKVNEYNGEHRFGGGNDHNCDPHVIDIIVAPAKGDGGEKDAQYRVLKSHTCDSAGGGKKAVVPMVYPGK